MLEAVSRMPALSKKKLGGRKKFRQNFRKNIKKNLMIVYYFLVFITRTSGGGEGINSGLGREGGGRGEEVSRSGGGGGKGMTVDVSLVQTPKKKNVYAASSGMQSMYRRRGHVFLFFFLHFNKNVCMWYAASSGMQSVYRRRRTHFSVFFFTF